MKIMDLTNEPMIAKTLIGGVLGTPEFKVSIDSTHVRVASKEFWFELRKEADGSTVIASNNIQPVKIKTTISIQRLKHCFETELKVYLKRYYNIAIKEEDCVLIATAFKK